MFTKNKTVMSLALGLAMVYSAGTMSAFASPNEQLQERPPLVQAQDQNNHPHPNQHKPNCKKNHPINEPCNTGDKKPVPPKDSQNKKPVSPKKHDEKKQMNSQFENQQDIPNRDR
ncbi:hypothetical protein [Sporomusa termitida]|uniref:Uncharacterized protein n=1 Tax=Sporomusa termitida TaxID=2377 RepID=A0A517DSX2_9FIRM|nr:hypothetical protein [Sporomusa termitida]QDR80453.1 hypothetical protein SPTER_17800 [Sporomusa termitida]